VSQEDLVAGVVTPISVDAEIAVSLLLENRIAAQHFATVTAFADTLDQSFGCVILVEESLVADELPALREALDRMPSWWDLPLIIVSHEVSARAALIAVTFPESGNVTFLEQPLNPHTLLSAVRVAFRAASRQREVADLIAERERAVKLRDEFLAMLAHELRNPLAPMRNVLYLFKLSSAQDAAVAGSVNILERQVNHLVRLVDDLMDVARLERGKVALRTARIDLNRVVASAVQTCLHLAQERGQELLVQFSVDALMIEADEVRIAQIVSNLVGNAIKFSSRSCQIRVTTSVREGWAVLSVEDQGIGFDPMLAEDLFSPFVQASATLERATGGLGMGLTIVKRLVELHGGSVLARSEGPGKGAQFVVRIPLAQGPSTARDESDRPLKRASHRRVVVIEDNPDIRHSLSVLLTRWGHEVATAEDGPSGVQRVLEDRPHVALVDIGLPRMNGYEVARTIRKLTPTGAVRLIAVSGYGQPVDKELALQAGFDLHLLKPVDPEVLETLLGE
jgi:signal transduction histidine kinase